MEATGTLFAIITRDPPLLPDTAKARGFRASGLEIGVLALCGFWACFNPHESHALGRLCACSLYPQPFLSDSYDSQVKQT